ncbi:MAG: hypothetical protein PHX38_03455 [Sulfuricella sp.]|nr:hypothetical protein [Sulfuricella sp.]
MKKLLLLLASSAFVANFAVSAQAADYGKSDMGMDKMGDHQMMGKMMGMHKMTGTVEKIDAGKGTLTLKTGEGDLMLHFPPSALKDVKQGDTVSVQLGIMKEGGMKK